jgi:hypothetical protein
MLTYGSEDDLAMAIAPLPATVKARREASRERPFEDDDEAPTFEAASPCRPRRPLGLRGCWTLLEGAALAARSIRWPPGATRSRRLGLRRWWRP